MSPVNLNRNPLCLGTDSSLIMLSGEQKVGSHEVSQIHTERERGRERVQEDGIDKTKRK